MLLWWAIEAKSSTDPEAVVALFRSKDAWDTPIARKYLVERLARRFTAERTDSNFAACAKLLGEAPDESSVAAVIAGMGKGLEGAALDSVPAPLERPIAELWEKTPRPASLVSVALRLGFPQARDEAVARVASAQTATAERTTLIDALGDARQRAAVPVLLGCAGKGQPKPVRAAALGALEQFDDSSIAGAMLKLYPDLPPDLRGRVVAMLVSRAAWARTLLQAVGAGDFDRKDLAQDQVRRLALLHDPGVDALAADLYGPQKGDGPDEKKRAVERFRQLIASPGGDALRGKTVFAATCGQCHAVQGEGNRIGPDLTGFDPRSPDFFLQSTVDPNAVIRPEYAAYVIETTDGRVLNGLIVASGPDSVTVEDGTARVTVAQSRVKRISESPVSRMPEGLLEAMQPQQVKDLFAYLASPDPHAAHGTEPPPAPVTP
jgi:putative heme-binding domain-containing protein